MAQSATPKRVHSMTVGGFGFRAEVNLGHVLSFVTLLAAGVWAVANQQSQIDVLRNSQSTTTQHFERTTGELSQRVDRQQSATDSQLVEARIQIGALKVANARIETKLENILETLARIEKRLDAAD